MIVILDELIEQIQNDQNQRENYKIDEPFSIYIIHSNSNETNLERSAHELGGDFLNAQLLIDCLINITPTINDKNELITFWKQSYHDKPTTLNIINEFEKEYTSDRALWWYTRNSFLYEMLNKALRRQDIHLLYLCRFIIHDIEKLLEKYKCSTPIRVYRTQLLSNEEVQMLKDSLGDYISIKSFFSTTLERDLARFYGTSSCISNDLECIHFEIDADPQLNNIKPFSHIASFSHFPCEEEVLFMSGSIFRIVNIDRDKDGMLIIHMRLCSPNDHSLKPLVQQMQKKYKGRKTTLLDLANILMYMGNSNDAEKYYHRCLNEYSDNNEYVASCYHGLGSVAKKKGDYQLSLEYHNKSLAIKMQILNPDNSEIANSHNSIGTVYKALKDYQSALQSYEEALVIYMQAFDDDHVDVAKCQTNIGNIYYDQCKYLDALDFYKQALAIREKRLTADHPRLGCTHVHIGNVYKNLDHDDLALSHYNLSLKIFKKSRSSQHPSIATTMKSIGLIYENKNDLEQALSFLKKAANIYKCSLSADHQDIIQIEQDIQRIVSKMS